MNHSTASSQWISTGQYIAVYRTYRSTTQEAVTDARGEPIRYRTAEQAEVAAWRALFAKIERIEAVHLDPAQIKRPANPKSRIGKRVAADSVFKERASA